jgi:hypothetical protein
MNKVKISKQLNKSKEEMSVSELRILAEKLGLVTKAKAKSMKKPELLQFMQIFEDSVGAEEVKEEEVVVDDASEVVGVVENWPMGMHEGKKIVSSIPVELNGKNYKDITVEGGITYRVSA